MLGAPAASWAEADAAIPADPSVSPDGSPAMWIVLKVGGRDPRPVLTDAVAVPELLAALGIRLRGRDRVSPNVPTLQPGMHLSVIRVRTRVETDQEVLVFHTITQVSDQLAAGEVVVLTPGKDGSVLRTYRITTRNGAEVSRVVLNEQILSMPTDQVVLVGPQSGSGGHGTQSGQASWYNCPNEGDFAAHLTLPKGTVVTVTNLATGAQVTVVINDRGPSGVAGRIIDLCSAAFAQIAPLAQGVANVTITW
jgi:rare lipoprotein A